MIAKKVILTFLVVFSAVSIGLATPALKWGITDDSSPADWLGDLSGAALASSQSDPTVGCFVQLLYASDGTIDPINLSNLDGHGGTDVVVAYGYVGFGTGASTVEGYFWSGVTRQATVGSYTVGVDQFYIRAWNAPVNSAGAYASGYAPIGVNGSATYYGDSAKHTLLNNAVADSWTLSSGFDTTIAVPEPSTIGLLLVGAGLVAFRRMRRS